MYTTAKGINTVELQGLNESKVETVFKKQFRLNIMQDMDLDSYAK